MAKKQKYYVVWQGHEPGIYNSWGACQQQIKNYPNAKYKSFESKAAAEAAFDDDWKQSIGKKAKKTIILDPNHKPIWESISVDAACSGNPGPTEYQGVDTKTGTRLFHLGPLAGGTNNLGEFLALVHGLAYLKQLKSPMPIYTDSRTAMSWVRKKKVRTQIKRTPRNKTLFELVARGERWLQANTYTTEILKWDTPNWGEIPADFGRK